MAGPLTAHPAADRATARALCVEQSRPVVGLSTLLADALATAGDRQVALVTPSATRLTYPLELALAGGPHRWIVRGAPFTDGLTGEPVHWDGDGFVSVGPAPGAPVPGSSGTVRLDITAVHHADESTELGGPVEDATMALLGAAPTGWGMAEPALQRWTRREPTRICRERAPRPTTLVVVADHGTVGILTVRRTSTGVHERLRLAVGSSSGPDRAGLDAAATALAHRQVRTMSAVWQPGRADVTRAPGPPAPPEPLGLLVDADHARALTGADSALDVTLIAGAGWVRLNETDPHTALRRVARLLAPSHLT